MNQTPDRLAVQIDRGLAYVCQNLGYVQSRMAGRPAAQRAALGRLVADTPAAHVAEDLEIVHRALRSAGDQSGVFGQSSVRSLHAVGIDREDDAEPVLRCPREHHPCARYAQPVPGAGPVCELTGNPLRLDRLQP